MDITSLKKPKSNKQKGSDTMYIIIAILIILLIITISYLFLIKKELKRIVRITKNIKDNDSNYLLNSEIPLKELKSLIKEINHLLKDLNTTKINYLQKEKGLRKMITNISHDLRTPLTSALGYTDLLLNNDYKNKENKETIEIIKERLVRLDELINSFFELTKITTNNNPPELNEVNLISIIEECIVDYYEVFKRDNRQIIVNKLLSKYLIYSNKEMLIRVFDNLISNAYKHSTGNLKITIEKKETIIIIFENKLTSNNLDLNHIFDEFYTMDISRTKGNTGLGLAISKEFIETLHGKIKATRKGNNLQITIEL